MLKVSYSNTREGQRWTLCGRIAGAWVEELRSFWNQARGREPAARAVVDLREVTFIDASGESLLAEMKLSGAELVAAGAANKYLVATLLDEQDLS